jgi:hypothetical protein
MFVVTLRSESQPSRDHATKLGVDSEERPRLPMPIGEALGGSPSGGADGMSCGPPTPGGRLADG